MSIGEQVAVGKHVEFGRYFQKNKKQKQPITWTVLKLEESRALLISDIILECMSFANSAPFLSDWKNSSLRHWLNEEFLQEAFSEEEQGRILSTTVVADYAPLLSGIVKGSTTVDKVFLLSVPEATEYYSSGESRKCDVSEVLIETTDAPQGWWLRSPGIVRDRAARVDNGDGEMYNLIVSCPEGVRPVMWVILEE